VRFRLLEDDNWDDDLPLQFEIDFSGASGAAYELNVRSNCGIVTPLEAHDGSVFNVPDTSDDNSTDIWVEVKQLSGPCPSSGTWTLKVYGN
jgi:hypothetical protein